MNSELRELLLIAANMIEDDAVCLRECSTVDGEWDAGGVRQVYEYQVDVVRRLRVAAEGE